PVPLARARHLDDHPPLEFAHPPAVLGPVGPFVELLRAQQLRLHRAHGRPPWPPHFAAATTFLAASVKSAAVCIIGNSDRAASSICRARSTLVPSRRTTTGTRKPTSRPALTRASAIRSHLAIPPKMLTSTPFTRESARMIRNASMAPASVTPPPTSRKLAGSPPWYLMMSIVAIASPAPLTRQPMLPVRLM